MINNSSAITIYSTSWCGPCASAKRLLKEKGFSFDEVDIEEKGMTREDLYEKTGGRTVPQIVVDGKTIGGYDNLLELESDGMLIV
ncbi:glutaredoxin family protein [Candidatus Marinimicrobia bacterium]|nr:glutaredoxin family protein [Candidatus Neomarinimicrobiota bacterium]MDB2351169.1 glutaredoxin family protein [Candidatus Neomarinimicrobiota bacterium]MDC3333565.1 glutaredoxin family protein [Candidatus Neomarinimicrobiota bacterium]|tara:strand:- start:377 stop:631 length:255 start_codon:yes stop_codon:yes gene_type:complete